MTSAYESINAMLPFIKLITSLDTAFESNRHRSPIMGIPYSKEINAAFEQVTPLVAAGYEVLTTTKDVAILLACIQVLTVVFLFLILLALLGVLLSVNPDLAAERQQLVTPAVQWLAHWVLTYGRIAKWLLNVLFVVLIIGYGMFLWRGYFTGLTLPKSEGEEPAEAPEQGKEGKKDAEDQKSKNEKKQQK